MTNLTKVVKRVTAAQRHEKSKTRAVILSLEPPARVGVRLEGTRQTYRLDAEAIYELAVMAHERDIARRAKQISREEKFPMRRAMGKARKELKARLV